jgi:hypothetical protein
MKKDYLSLYLDKYAETKAKNIAASINLNEFTYHHCLVIPAYNESPKFLARLENSLDKRGPILVIIVINQPDTDPAVDTSQKLWETLRAKGANKNKSEEFLVVDQPDLGITFLGINCFAEGERLPEKQGVGLARKLGCDMAVALIQQRVLKTDWIHTTDADTSLPEDYFIQTAEIKNTSAVHYRFQHQGSDSAISQATQLYEKSLHYYVRGLQYAGSPYGFYTIGSCIVVNANSYAQARGFPKKAGGEDFYLLNKLAKLGEIKVLDGEPIIIEARKSNRAPFGTGPAVEKILAMKNPEQEFLYYHPQVFEELKIVLRHFSNLYNFREDFSEWLKSLSKASRTSLIDNQIEQLFNHLQKQAKTEEQYHHFIREWLDAFKTLKFIHGLRNTYKDIPLIETLKQNKHFM